MRFFSKKNSSSFLFEAYLSRMLLAQQIFRGERSKPLANIPYNSPIKLIEANLQDEKEDLYFLL